MSLNEIVNCPAQYASSKPYIVVQHIDWIQCRYLFVQVGVAVDGYGSTGDVSRAPDPSSEVKQDPAYTATSTTRKSIGIPLCAVKISSAFSATKTETQSKTKSDTQPSKRRKSGFFGSGSKSPMVELSVASEGETLSDLEFLFSEDESDSKSKGKGLAM